MKFVHEEWVNKNTMNASKRYERKKDEMPSERRIRRDYNRMFPYAAKAKN